MIKILKDVVNDFTSPALHPAHKALSKPDFNALATFVQVYARSEAAQLFNQLISQRNIMQNKKNWLTSY